MSKCPTCPAIDVPGRCPGEAARRLCGLPMYRAALLDAAEGVVVPVPALVTIASLRAVRACPHFEAASDCGCGVNRCALGKGRDGDGLVTLNDCLACLAEGG